MTTDKSESMPCQDPQVRVHNFNEVALGFSSEQAVKESLRCLGCVNKPCVAKCPVGIDIPGFIKPLSQGDFRESYQVLSKYSCLPAVCGRVCPQENQCESVCVRAIKGQSVAIGRLERFVADWWRDNTNELPQTKSESNGHKVAIVGSGPAGLTCAGELAREGFSVTIFEALHKPGGVLAYGIPEFRLPKNILQNEIDKLIQLGVQIKTNMVIGRIITIDELFEQGFEAVFVGTGAGLPKFMGINGENYNGVFSANEFLTRINLMGAYKKDSQTPIFRASRVAVIGGGNVAMDVARASLRLGSDIVNVVYRRGFDELPARREEVQHALQEGITFKTLSNPLEILGDDGHNVNAIRIEEMQLGEVDSSGRRRPISTGKTSILDVDCVIMALGTSPNPLIKTTTPGLETHSWGGIITKDDSGLTSRDLLWAGGDAVTGAATVIMAMGSGKQAAQAISKKILKI